jgi:hypothetical protein
VRERLIYHYTDRDGGKAVGSQRTWTFRSGQPPGDHPFGAYFTTLGPETINLAKRLRIPREKLEYVFCFTDNSDMKRLEGGRGEFILYSPSDYTVEEARQRYWGLREEAEEKQK